MILPENKHFSNIVLIGMAGAGKSTVGPMLARRLDFSFIDTDELIAASHGQSLQAVLDQQGRERFQALEEKILCSINPQRHVIATGGSAVYSRRGMTHLAEISLVVWLDVPLAELKERVGNLDNRGLVNPDGTDFEELYHQRLPLYQKYSGFRLACAGLSPAQIVETFLLDLLEHNKQTARPRADFAH
jgi:shikimate kinase